MPKITTKRLLYLELLFTAFAFFLMIVLSYSFMSKTMRVNLVNDVGSVFDYVSATIEFDLHEPQMMLSDFAQTVRSMILHGDSAGRLQDYTADISDHIRLKEEGRLSGLYGYIDKFSDGPVFLNGLNTDPPDSYSPVDRPWYQAALAAGGGIAETLPYKDVVTGEFIVTYSCCIFDNDSSCLGAVGIDVKIGYIGEKTLNSPLTKYGYGMLVSQDLSVIAHSNPDFMGKKMDDPVIPISVYVKEMVEQGVISEAPLINWKGEKGIVFARRLQNGWYLSLLTLSSVYYKSLTNMSLVLILLGITLAAVLTFAMINLDAARNKSDMESRHKSAFLANMSHEIRTPMNAIIGMTTIGKSASDAERKDYCFTKIQDASNHLLGVINNVLDLSKIEANKFELSVTEFNFEEMLQRVVNVVNFRIDEKKQKLKVHIDRAIPKTLIGDDQRFAQVIANLLGNANKFTPEQGDINLVARLAGQKNGICTLEISVSDSGIGIDPEQQAKLFQSFEQAESGTTRKYGGTGLGLAISKNIVEMMGGKIWIQSEAGKGSTFSFTVQAQRGTEKEQAFLSRDANRDNIRVLVADDDPDVLVYFKEILQSLGISCDTAISGEEAFRLIERNRPYHIYFVDWKMPGMDGIDVTEKLKTQSSENSVVIMISAAEWSTIAEVATKAGVDKFLSKPLFPSTIAGIINECMGKDKQQEEDVQANIGGLFTGRRILLAEDVDINREIVKVLLEPTQVEIDCAENGREAVHIFSKAPEKYELILMDVQMPEMDGYEATRHIRNLNVPKAKTVPIIAMTANVFREDIEKCLEAGMNSHIGKPLDLNEVAEKLKRYLTALPKQP
jgi:signal transduction histidine kinase/CheY-like chemotaxis protein